MTADPAKQVAARDALDNRARGGAGGHGWLLIAELSRARVNRELDRALVVPTVDEESVGGAVFGGCVG